MRVGVKLYNFVPGGEDGEVVFEDAVDLEGDAWIAAQSQVYQAVMTGINGVVRPPLIPYLNGGSGIITLKAGDTLIGEEVDSIRQTVSDALAPFRVEGK